MRSRSSISPKYMPSKQRGSALIIAVFVLVIMGLLGASLMQMMASSSSSASWEVLGNRALMAADSAGEMALFQLFPPGQSQTTCSAITQQNITYDPNSGLAGCSAAIQCIEFDQIALGSHHYRITSTGRCQAGSGAEDTIDARRSITLEARTAIP